MFYSVYATILRTTSFPRKLFPQQKYTQKERKSMSAQPLFAETKLVEAKGPLVHIVHRSHLNPRGHSAFGKEFTSWIEVLIST